MYIYIHVCAPHKTDIVDDGENLLADGQFPRLRTGTHGMSGAEVDKSASSSQRRTMLEVRGGEGRNTINRYRASLVEAKQRQYVRLI